MTDDLPRTLIDIARAGMAPDLVKHTPGPWELGPWIDSMGGHVYRIVYGASRRLGAISVYGKRPDTGKPGGRPLKGGGTAPTESAEECEANAHLIAAAPDLLALLKRVIDYDIPPTIVAQMRAVIAKAEGRS